MRKTARKGVILLVEDDPEDQRIAMDGLRSGGSDKRLFAVSNGEEALDYLYRRGRYAAPAAAPRPDLILLDLNMPKLDGRAVLRTVKEDRALRPIPVVILTTSSHEEDIVQSYQLGANSFVTKPTRINAFLHVMREVERYWLELVALPCT